MVSRHILVPADETSVTSALIGSPAKPQTAVFVIVDVGGGSNVTNAMATSSVFSPGNNFASVYDKLSFGIMKMGGDVQGPFSYPMSTCDYNGLKKAVKPMVSGTYNHYMWYFGSKVSDCAWSGIGSEGNAAKPQIRRLVQRQHRLHRPRPGGRAQPWAGCTRRRWPARARRSRTIPSRPARAASTVTA